MMSMPRCQLLQTQMQTASKGFRVAIDSIFTEGSDCLQRFQKTLINQNLAQAHVPSPNLAAWNSPPHLASYFGQHALLLELILSLLDGMFSVPLLGVISS